MISVLVVLLYIGAVTCVLPDPPTQSLVPVRFAEAQSHLDNCLAEKPSKCYANLKGWSEEANVKALITLTEEAQAALLASVKKEGDGGRQIAQIAGINKDAIEAKDLIGFSGYAGFFYGCRHKPEKFGVKFVNDYDAWCPKCALYKKVMVKGVWSGGWENTEESFIGRVPRTAHQVEMELFNPYYEHEKVNNFISLFTALDQDLIETVRGGGKWVKILNPIALCKYKSGLLAMTPFARKNPADKGFKKLKVDWDDLKCLMRTFGIPRDECLLVPEQGTIEIPNKGAKRIYPEIWHGFTTADERTEFHIDLPDGVTQQDLDAICDAACRSGGGGKNAFLPGSFDEHEFQSAKIDYWPKRKVLASSTFLSPNDGVEEADDPEDEKAE